MEVKIPCPKCHRSFAFPLDGISPGKGVACPNCGGVITFAGQDAAKVQETIDRLAGQLGEGSVKVTVRTKVKRPWWRLWGA